MKRLLNNTQSPLLFKIDLTIYIDKDIFDPDNYRSKLVASVDPNLFDLPQGHVISQFQEQVSSKEIDDFMDFVDEVESYLVDVNGLEVIYKNKSDYNSVYYTCVAKDAEGNIITRFELRIRISNHNSHRTSEQQKNRRQEELYVKEALEKKKIPADKLRKMQKLYISFKVNNEVYTSYSNAFIDITDAIDDKIRIMKRKYK